MERIRVSTSRMFSWTCMLIRLVSLRLVKMLMDIISRCPCRMCHLNQLSFIEASATRLRRVMRPRAKVLTAIVCLGVMVVTTLMTIFGMYTSPLQTVPSMSVLQLLKYNPRATDIFGDVRPSRNASSYLRCVDPEGVGYVEDTLCMARPAYMPSYKNPCWHDWNAGKVRCLPYFHILGVDKSGTTDLHSRLARHPHVLNNSGGLGKETYYWCWLKYGQFMKKAKEPTPFSYYLRLFDDAATTIRKNPDQKGFHRVITGDATPMDFWDFRAWPLIPQNKGLREPAVLTPHLMRHLYPDPKFIIIMRNPVDRLYSDYIFLRYGKSPEDFQKHVPLAVSLMNNCLKVFTYRQCVFSNDTYTHLPMRIHVGMYSVFMKEWLEVFPRSSFYILRTEDYHSNMAYHLRNLHKFLGLDPLPDDMFQTILNADLLHVTAIKTTLNDMFPDTRQILQDFYAPYNEELARLLDDDAFLWGPGSVKTKNGTVATV